MACDHKQFKCVSNRFYCLKCGKEIPNPYEEKKPRKKKGE